MLNNLILYLYVKPITDRFKSGPYLVKFPRASGKPTLQSIYYHDYLIALNNYFNNFSYNHDISQYRSKTIKDYQKAGDYHKIYYKIF